MIAFALSLVLLGQLPPATMVPPAFPTPMPATPGKSNPVPVTPTQQAVLTPSVALVTASCQAATAPTCQAASLAGRQVKKIVIRQRFFRRKAFASRVTNCG